MSDPRAAFLAIGDELLSGKVDDTNSRHAIARLRGLGIALRRVWLVPDEIDEIAFAVSDSSRRFEHVFTSGGVGPTHDDVTFEGVARAFDQGIVRHPEIGRRIHDYFGARTNEALLKMADVPAEAELVRIVDGLVPVLRIRNVYVLPGVPELFVRCFDAVVENLSGRPFHLVRLHTHHDEGMIADALRETQDRFVAVAIGSYPRFGHADYHVLVTLESRDAEALGAAVAHLRALLPAAWIEPPPG